MATASASRGGWRRFVFAPLAALFALCGLVWLDGLTELLMPWRIVPIPGSELGAHPELHRWHGALHGALLALLLSGSLVVLLWRSADKPLLLQFFLFGHAFILGGFHAFAFQPWFQFKPFFVLVFLTIDALLIATYPAPRALLDLRLPGRRSRLLAGLTLLCALALAPSFWSCLGRQLDGSAEDEHVTGFRWAETLVVYVSLVTAGWLASSRRGGWRELGFMTGGAYLYLGAAALAVPDQAGSWGVGGGALSLLGGAAYVGLTFVEGRARLSAPKATG